VHEGKPDDERVHNAAAMESLPAAHASPEVEKVNVNSVSPSPGRQLRIVLDRDLCQGHGVCVGEAPELFKLGEDGLVELCSDAPIAPELHVKARAAAQYCPTRTIKIQEQ
jgi:sterol 14-demethylase